MADNPFLGQVARTRPVEPDVQADPVAAVEQAPPVPVEESNPFLSLVEKRPDPATALELAAKTKPDDFAKTKQLADQTGLPTDTVERNRDRVQNRQSALDGAAALADAPATKDWLLASPDNAKLASDSVPQLAKVEKGFRDIGEAQQMQIEAETGSAAGLRGFGDFIGGGVQAVGSALAGTAEFAKVFDRFMKRTVDPYLPGFAQPIEMPEWLRPDAALSAGELIKKAGAALMPEDPAFVDQVVGGVGQLAAQAAVYILAGPASALPGMFAQGVDQAHEDTVKHGVAKTPTGDFAELLGGAATAVTEKLGLDLILNKIPASVRSQFGRILSGMAVEGVQEFSEQLLNNLTAIALYDPSRSVFEGTVENAQVGGAVGAIAGAVIPGHVAIKQRNTMNATQKAVAASPLASRDPRAAADHVAEAMRANGVDVYIPVEAVDKIMSNIDPAIIHEALGITQAEVDTARARGGDVRVSEQAFAKEFLLDPARYEGIKDQVRYGPEAMNAAEAEALPATAAEQAKNEPMPVSQTGTVANQAATEAISLAQEQMGLRGLFQTAADAGLTEPQYVEYLAAKARAQEVAVKRQEAKVLAQQEHGLSLAYTAEAEKVRGEFDQRLRIDVPVYSALDSIGRERLNKQAVLDTLGGDEALFAKLPKQELPNARPRALTQAEGGITNLEGFAQQNGFDNATDMLLELMTAPPIHEAVAQQVAIEMKKRYGDLMDKQQAVAEARNSLLTDESANVLLAELNALHTAPAPRGSEQAKANAEAGRLRLSSFKSAARQSIQALPISQIMPKAFLNTAATLGKKAGTLLRTGRRDKATQTNRGSDRSGAAKAKFQQLLNFEYAREAYGVQKEIAVAIKRLKKLANPNKAIEGIDADWRDKILELLAPFDFKEVNPSDKTLAKLKPGDPTPYRSMTLGAFNTVYQQAMYLRAQGINANKAFVRGQQIALATATMEIGDQLDKMTDLGRVERAARGGETGIAGVFYDKKDKVSAALTSLQSSIVNIGFLLQRIDGGRIGGIAHKYVMAPIAAAQNRELQVYQQKMQPLLDEMSKLPKAVQQWMTRRVFVQELGRVMSGSQITMALLNMGNPSNMQKMIEGSKQDGGLEYNQAALNRVANAAPAEIGQWVQHVWDTFETLRPEVEAIYRRENGISPKRVEAASVNIGGKERKGGYFPMLYDPLHTDAMQLAGNKTSTTMGPTFATGVVFSGMTEARSEGYAAPVLTDISGFGNAVRRHVHFITHYEAIDNLRKILGDRTLNAQITAKLGPEYKSQLDHWVQAVASDNSKTKTFGDIKAFNAITTWLRNSMTVATLTASYTTMVSQTFGVLTSVRTLGLGDDGKFSNIQGVKYMAVGFDRYLADPKGATEDAFARSNELPSRVSNFEQDASRALRHLAGKSGLGAQAEAATIRTIGGMQLYTVDIPTWIGAYNKGLDSGRSEQDAAMYADDLLVKSQGSGHIKDLSALQRNRGFAQLLTMFSTYSTVAYAMTVQDVASAKKVKDVPQAVSRMFWLIGAAAVADAFMRQQGPPADKDKDLAWWSLRFLSQTLSNIPVAGSVLRSLLGGHDPKLSSVESLGSRFNRSMQSVVKMVQQMHKGGVDRVHLTAKELRNLGVTTWMFTGKIGAAQMDKTLSAVEKDSPNPYDYVTGYQTKKQRAQP